LSVYETAKYIAWTQTALTDITTVETIYTQIRPIIVSHLMSVFAKPMEKCLADVYLKT